MPSIEELKKLIKNHEAWYPRWRKQFRILWIRSIFSQCFSKFSIFEAFKFLGAIITICFLASCFPEIFTRCLSNLSTVLGGFKCLLSSPYLGWTTTTTMTQHDIYCITTMVTFFSAGLKPPTMAEVATRNSTPKCGGCDQRPGHLPMVLTRTGSVWGNSGGWGDDQPMGISRKKIFHDANDHGQQTCRLD